jgi:hypothetical protein
MKVRPMGAELSDADRQKDMTKLIQTEHAWMAYTMLLLLLMVVVMILQQ